MDCEKIASTQLYSLSATTKDLINSGMWFLYAIDYEQVPNAKFFLSTDGMGYFLSENGSVVSKNPKIPNNLDLSRRVLFGDIKITDAIPNVAILWK